MTDKAQWQKTKEPTTPQQRTRHWYQSLLKSGRVTICPQCGKRITAIEPCKRRKR